MAKRHENKPETGQRTLCTRTERQPIWPAQRGVRNRTSLAAEALLYGEAEALTRKAVDLALGSDVQALRICLERICPPRKDRPISINLPMVETAADAVKANAAIMQAVSSGEITLAEGGEVMQLLESFSRTLGSPSRRTACPRLSSNADVRSKR